MKNILRRRSINCSQSTCSIYSHVTFLYVYIPKFHCFWFFHFKILKRMDVAAASATALPTADTDLFDFIESLEREEKFIPTTTTVAVDAAAAAATTVDTTISDSSSTINNRDFQSSSDVWNDIAEALNNWTQRILAVESIYNNKVDSFRQTIEQSLQRQQLDGFLNHQDVSELRYITDLWSNLLQAISCYTVGCASIKRDIITYLLELHVLGQINSNLFIETCLKL